MLAATKTKGSFALRNINTYVLEKIADSCHYKKFRSTVAFRGARQTYVVDISG